MKTFNDVIPIFGNTVLTAKALGLSVQTICNYRDGREVHPKICSKIELKTNGAVTRKDLRPDDWMEIWPELEAA